MKKIKTPKELEDFRESLLKKRDPDKTCVTICGSTGCRAHGGGELIRALQSEINRNRLKGKVDVRITGCHGFCEQGPLVIIHPRQIFYQQVKPSDVPELVSQTLLNDKVIERLLYKDPVKGEKVIHEGDVEFYKKQMRLIFGNNGKIDPTDITDYIAIGGYKGLSKVLTSMSPEQVIQEITTSGLRGRGGAGFPTGVKWQITRGSIKKYQSKNQINFNSYIICNADEGDPGAFMDRSLLEGNPYSVLEGMIIGAWAICGSTKAEPQGYIYVRNEYPLAIKRLQIALKQAQEYGFLGNDILGTGFGFNIQIVRGAGAFVCGEETALLESVEDKIGEPRPKPPYPANKGLWGMPTNINNVKTWATVPLIINNGAEWFSKMGTENSKGTMVFSLVGKINNTGLVEVPLGIMLKEIIYGVGGGIPEEKKFKAVQTGGPSGGCIPESMLDLPVDYESLTKAGSIMGSGGMIVMDENTCMVDTAKYFLNFTVEESCGKCTPCRDGIKHMLDILTNITEGEGKPGDIALLEKMGKLIKETAFCALGKTAPNPVLTTIRYFRDEYKAHIHDKRCPAKVCKTLITFSILEDKCNGCHRCFKECSTKAVSGEPKKPHQIDEEKCIKCGICHDVCKFNAVRIE